MDIFKKNTKQKQDREKDLRAEDAHWDVEQ